MPDDDAEEPEDNEATEDDAEAADDSNATEDDRQVRGRNADEETVEDVDHEHPTTGETFDRTGVHGRGKKHPDATANEDTADDPTEDSDDGESA